MLVSPLARLTGSASARAAVARFAITGIIVLAAVGVGAVEVLRAVGRDEAVREAREVTRLAGEGIVAPAITPELLRGDGRSIDELDRIVGSRVLRPPVVRVKLWDARGRIVYSDERRLIGTTYPLPADERQALASGRPDAEISDVERPENRFERGRGKVLEVYLGIRTPQGRRLLFETYQRYGSVASSGRRLWQKFLPVLIGALGLLALFQIPLAWALARRVRRAERERLQSLEHSLDIQEQERRRIAGDLHDGVVQTLVGVSYRLAAAQGQIEPRTPHALVEAVTESARETRDSIRQLRSLLVDIYPPSLQREGLAAALQDLMTRATRPDLATTLDLPAAINLAPAREALLFRAAQEALRNAVTHAGARNIQITVAPGDGTVSVTIRDDGSGFDPRPVFARAPNGHFGLRALDDLVRDQGGTMHLDTAPGAGTALTVEVPAS